MKPPLLAIVGPTCVGKTAVAVEVARLLAPAELINADSRQVRRGLRVGTCTPTEAELHGVPCHLIDMCAPGTAFSVADWVHAAREVLAGLDQRNVLGIVVGGTGLYVTGLVDGFDFARVPPDPQTRAARTARAAAPSGLAELVEELRVRDPDAAAAIETRNPRRVLRALEILDGRNGSLRTAQRGIQPTPAVIVEIDAPRAIHARWIEARTAAMFLDGSLLAEVRRQLAAGVRPEDLAACGIGYAEALEVLDGSLELEDAIARVTRRTLQYAKAQRTYWRRDARVVRVERGTETATATAERVAALSAEHPFALRADSCYSPDA